MKRFLIMFSVWIAAVAWFGICQMPAEPAATPPLSTETWADANGHAVSLQGYEDQKALLWIGTLPGNTPITASWHPVLLQKETALSRN